MKTCVKAMVGGVALLFVSASAVAAQTGDGWPDGALHELSQRLQELDGELRSVPYESPVFVEIPAEAWESLEQAKQLLGRELWRLEMGDYSLVPERPTAPADRKRPWRGPPRPRKDFQAGFAASWG